MEKDRIKLVIYSFTSKCEHSSIENNKKSSIVDYFNTEYITDCKLYEEKIKIFQLQNYI